MELTEAEIKRLEEIQPTLISLYKDAGYARAIELQKQIEDITKKSIFDIKEIQIESANCFHSGTWAVWFGDGVEDMKSMLEGDYYKSVDEIIEVYKGNAPCVRKYVEVAEEYLKGLNKEPKKFTVTIAVDGRLDIEVEARNLMEAKEKAIEAFATADLSKMEIVGSDPVNCTDEDDNLFDYD